MTALFMSIMALVAGAARYFRRAFIHMTAAEAHEIGLTHYAWHGCIPIYLVRQPDGPAVCTRQGFLDPCMYLVDWYQLLACWITNDELGYTFFVTGRLDGEDDTDDDEGDFSDPINNQGSFNFTGAPHAS